MAMDSVLRWASRSAGADAKAGRRRTSPRIIPEVAPLEARQVLSRAVHPAFLGLVGMADAQNRGLNRPVLLTDSTAIARFPGRSNFLLRLRSGLDPNSNFLAFSNLGSRLGSGRRLGLRAGPIIP